MDFRPSALAVKIGADYIKGIVFQWLDGAIRLNSKESFEIKKQTNEPTKTWSERAISEFESKIMALAEADRKRGVDLAKTPMPVCISNACDVSEDGVATLPFFKAGELEVGTQNKYNPKETLSTKLSNANIPENALDLYIHNDGREQLELAARSFAKKAGLEKGDVVYHFISGQGFGGVSGMVGDESKIEAFQNREPGHRLMPDIDKYMGVEGYIRSTKLDSLSKIQGCAEPYVAGGNDNDPNAGPKATFKVLKYWADNDQKSDLKEALGMIEAVAKEVLGEKFTLSEKAVSQSSLHDKTQLSTRKMGEAAQDGDKLAKAILVFTAKRVADVMIKTIKDEKRFNGEKSPKLISYSGGLAKCFKNECPQAWQKLEGDLQSAFGDQLNLEFIEPKENMDGTVESVEAKLSQNQ